MVVHPGRAQTVAAEAANGNGSTSTRQRCESTLWERANWPVLHGAIYRLGGYWVVVVGFVQGTGADFRLCVFWCSVNNIHMYSEVDAQLTARYTNVEPFWRTRYYTCIILRFSFEQPVFCLLLGRNSPHVVCFSISVSHISICVLYSIKPVYIYQTNACTCLHNELTSASSTSQLIRDWIEMHF